MFAKVKEVIFDLWINISESSTVEKIRSSYESLPEREQKIIKILVIIFVLGLFINIIFSNLSEISDKEKKISEYREIVQQLDDLNALVLRSKSELKKLKKDAMGTKYVSLLDIIEKQQNSALIKPQSRIDLQETPRKEVDDGKFYENTASVKYNKITIRQLTRLLFGIEQSGLLVKISALKVKTRYDDDRYIDVEFEVTTRSPK